MSLHLCTQINGRSTGHTPKHGHMAIIKSFIFVQAIYVCNITANSYFSLLKASQMCIFTTRNVLRKDNIFGHVGLFTGGQTCPPRDSHTCPRSPSTLIVTHQPCLSPGPVCNPQLYRQTGVWPSTERPSCYRYNIYPRVSTFVFVTAFDEGSASSDARNF